MEKRNEWWKALAGLLVLAGLAVGLGLLLGGQGQPPVATEPTATATCTPTPTTTPEPTETPLLPAGTPGPRRLSAAAPLSAPEGFWPTDLRGDTAVGTLKVDNESQIVLLNLTTGVVKQISSATGPYGKGSARLSARWVVWIEAKTIVSQYDYRLKAYDLEAEREYTVEAEYPIRLDLSGDVVVWQTYGSDSNIFAQNLRTGQRWAVAEGPGAQKYPCISGLWVIYLDRAKYARDEQVADLWVYNLESGEDRVLGQEYYPLMGSTGTYHAISGSLVVWTSPSGEGDYLYERLRLVSLDLNDPGGQPSLVMPGDIAYLHLFDGILVYHKGNGKVLYDLQRGEALATIEPPIGIAVEAFISGDRLVWVESGVDDRYRSYAATIER